MKIIDIPGWERIEKAVGDVAAKRWDWFPNGFQGIHAVSNQELFAGTNVGRLYFSDADELVPGFRPASSLLGAVDAIAAGRKLSFKQEYAVETLWHELVHGFTGIKPGRGAVGSEPIEEGVIQAFARHSYPMLLSEMGGTASRQDKIIAAGYAYPVVTANLLEAMRLTGITKEALMDLVMRRKQEWETELTEALSVGLGIKVDSIRRLYNYASNKSPNLFMEKLTVLARNAPRNRAGF